MISADAKKKEEAEKRFWDRVMQFLVIFVGAILTLSTTILAVVLMQLLGIKKP